MYKHLLIIIALMFLMACDFEPPKIKHIIAKGKILHWANYKCEFGVLYAWGYEKIIMRDIKGDLIPCTIIELTDKEYEQRIKK